MLVLCTFLPFFYCTQHWARSQTAHRGRCWSDVCGEEEILRSCQWGNFGRETAFGLKCPPDDICSRSPNCFFHIFRVWWHALTFYTTQALIFTSSTSLLFFYLLYSMPSLNQKTWTKCSFLCPSVAKNTGSTESSKTWNTVITSDLQKTLKQLKKQKHV